MKKQVYITKADGSRAIFRPNKITTSLRRAGATPRVARNIADTVVKMVKPDMSTRDIYRKAFSLLKKHNERPVAARYSLRHAIEMLGPTGFPFEVFVANLLEKNGYVTNVGQVIKGQCIRHEVDVLAEKDDEKHMIECKFHNNPGYRTKVKVPLYIYARFLDVATALKKKHTKTTFRQWIVTNTKFTKDAIIYGECKGLTMIGWRYPKDGGLERFIEEHGLHPLTCLTHLHKQEKDALLAEHIVLACDLLGKDDMLKKLRISEKRIQSLYREIEALCTL